MHVFPALAAKPDAVIAAHVLPPGVAGRGEAYLQGQGRRIHTHWIGRRGAGNAPGKFLIPSHMELPAPGCAQPGRGIQTSVTHGEYCTHCRS
jgi:hypothetical protein